ncbi:mannitol-1-phosphate 5-dehydrogenase [Leifsonia poae]|uniref:mannitol-1-phosphate 5-dehydrogenase n=1 Tax=Leifsonia poae TaxID=110933 RepID=UPI003D667AF1
MRAVHFGAGTFGRGFVGPLLHEAGYEVVFADIDSELVAALAAAGSYRVREVGEGSHQRVVEISRAINSVTEPDALIAEIATADVVTTAVGPRILKFVAPLIAAGLSARPSDAAPLAVMACERAVGATDLLAAEVLAALPEKSREALVERAVFANTAVDRIIPTQDPDEGVDVTVEAFCEWVIERGPFAGAVPSIPGAHFVDDLGPYIERKLFTVNTGHATIAYAGFLLGAHTVSEALAFPEVRSRAQAVLAETSEALVAKHGFDPDELARYRATILERFANPSLVDVVTYVGREPLRKLSRNDRFIGPAADYTTVTGGTPAALLRAIGDALRFDYPADSQSVELQDLLRNAAAEDIVAEITAITPAEPLYRPLVETVRAAQRR